MTEQTELTGREAADAAKKPIDKLGAGFMFAKETRERGRAAGLRGKPLYHLGRGGALGDVPAEVVVSTFAFWPAGVVTEHWETGRAVMSPQDAAQLYAECCAEWGRAHLSSFERASRLVELLERVVDAAGPEGKPLFVGWRALPRPDDVPGRLALLLQLMREHRGAVHVAACAAVGLAGLPAVMAGPNGAANAQFFDWPEPYPDPAAYRAKWDAAEDLTAASAAIPYDEALDGRERAELVELLQEAFATAFPPAAPPTST